MSELPTIEELDAVLAAPNGFVTVTKPNGEVTATPVQRYVVKDSGVREQFDSGMVRDTTTGKQDCERVFDGPMFDRWADHITKGAIKYPDTDNQPNWMKASGEKELRRFRKSACRHFRQWLRGDKDEDHAAALFFNVNGFEFVKDRMGSAE